MVTGEGDPMVDDADARFWNKTAEGYAKKPVADPEAFERKIAVTQALMNPEHVVLDVGCGTGSLALRLAGHASQMHGLDLSSEMIRIARQKADAAGVKNTTFHVGPFDASFTALEDQSLDGICAYNIFHLVDDLPWALSRVFGLLKPGGFLVSSTPCLGEFFIPLTPVFKFMRWIGKAPAVLSFSKPELLQAMAQAGFVEVTQPDVGAKGDTAFVVAKKPG
jgi:ubiquinone/menaquinone biosynthesis C-methylase UbiE